MAYKTITQATHVGFDFSRFSEDMRKAREGRGVSVRGLGSATGINYTMIWRWETMRSMPNVGEYFLICAVLGLEPADYITMTEEAQYIINRSFEFGTGE